MRTTELDLASDVQPPFVMLKFAIAFLVIALIAAVFGFGGIAAGAAGIAQVLFWVFLVVAVATFAMNFAQKASA